MKVLLAALFCHLVLWSHLSAAQQPEITGAVAYTEVMQFDYTKDGIRNQVQFWLEFKGSPALGKPKEAGYTPESGAIFYYLVDIENKKTVDNWLMGFSMMEGPPPSGPYPMQDINIKGNICRFRAFDMTWTIIDGGDDHTKDTVTIDDGFRVRDMKLYAGDLKIVHARIEAHAQYRQCVECHEQPVSDMIAKGGEHSTMGCSECHILNSPETTRTHRLCSECHEPLSEEMAEHSEDLTEEDCGLCHTAHRATEVRYAFNVPSKYCSTCHQESAELLASSQSKHSNIPCALCHQHEHKAISTCHSCHGAPHPRHVMQNTEICGACHNTAHSLESARPERDSSYVWLE
jgi:predicted CXXCH cytochrome family protein